MAYVEQQGALEPSAQIQKPALETLAPLVATVSAAMQSREEGRTQRELGVSSRTAAARLHDLLEVAACYVRDLGLIVDRPQVRIANPIYQEVIPRVLNYVAQIDVAEEADWYTLPDGSLDMQALMRSIQAFFAERSEHWWDRFAYQEAGPHLIRDW